MKCSKPPITEYDPTRSPHIHEFSLALLLGVLTMLSSFTLSACSAWLIIRAWQQPTPLQLTIVVVSVRAAGLSRAIFRYGERVITHKMLFMQRVESILAVYRQRITAGFSMHALSGNMLISVAYQLADFPALVLLPVCIAGIVSGLIVIFYVCILWQAAVLLGVTLLAVILFCPYVSYLSQKRHLGQAGRIFQEYMRLIDMILQHREELIAVGALEHYRLKARDLLLQRDKYLGKSYRMQAISTALQIFFIGIAEVGCCYLAWTERYHFSAPTLGVLMMLPLLSFEAASLVGPAMHNALLTKDAQKHLQDSLPENQPQWIDTVMHRIQREHPEISLREGDPRAYHQSAVQESAIHLVTGPNGVGKTTTLLYLAGLIPSTRYELFAQSSQKSMVFLADSHIFHTSIKQNLLLAQPLASEKECIFALEVVGLMPQVQELPAKLDSPALILSRGQKKLLALARWVIALPMQAFIDEPLENLNPARLDRIIQLLLDPQFLSYRLIATHDAQLIQAAQRQGNSVFELNQSD